jgi:hypothetical protein
LTSAIEHPHTETVSNQPPISEPPMSPVINNHGSHCHRC